MPLPLLRFATWAFGFLAEPCVCLQALCVRRCAGWGLSAEKVVWLLFVPASHVAGVSMQGHPWTTSGVEGPCLHCAGTSRSCSCCSTLFYRDKKSVRPSVQQCRSSGSPRQSRSSGCSSRRPSISSQREGDNTCRFRV